MNTRELIGHMRAVREAYDALSRGDRAVLRRCRNEEELVLDGIYWQIAGHADREAQRCLPCIVLCYPAAKQLKNPARFRLGTMFRRSLHPGAKVVRAGDAIRFRQLLAARDRSELAHRLRRLLKQAGVPVDWGTIGCDVHYWGANVRRRWAQDFYAPDTEEEQ